MIFKTPIIASLVGVLVFVTGCATSPPLTKEECGLYPDNYVQITIDYAKKQLSNAKAAGDSGKQELHVFPSSEPQLSKDCRHPGWLVHAQREIVTYPGRGVDRFSWPFSIIIYNGKVVWSSDEQYGVKLPP